MTTCELAPQQLKISSTGTIEARSRELWVACEDASASTRNPSRKRTHSAPVGTRTHAQGVRDSHRNRQFDAFSNRTPKADASAEKNRHLKVGGSAGNIGEGKETAPIGSGTQLVPGRRPKTGFVTVEKQKSITPGIQHVCQGSVFP